jgi:hypothetical protein
MLPNSRELSKFYSARAATAAKARRKARRIDCELNTVVLWFQDTSFALVQEVLGVPKDIVYESCSNKVGEALGPDVMKSVKHLIPDILAALPLLLYQGTAFSLNTQSLYGNLLNLLVFRVTALLLLL